MVLADTAHNCCFRMKVEFSPFPCRFLRQNDCSRSSLPSTTSIPRHLRFSKKSPKFSNSIFHLSLQICQKGRLFPFILILDNRDPPPSRLFWKRQISTAYLPALTTILTWASMRGNYMINVWWPLKVAQFGQKSWRRVFPLKQWLRVEDRMLALEYTVCPGVELQARRRMDFGLFTPMF